LPFLLLPFSPQRIGMPFLFVIHRNNVLPTSYRVQSSKMGVFFFSEPFFFDDHVAPSQEIQSQPYTGLISFLSPLGFHIQPPTSPVFLAPLRLPADGTRGPVTLFGTFSPFPNRSRSPVFLLVNHGPSRDDDPLELFFSCQRSCLLVQAMILSLDVISSGIEP